MKQVLQALTLVFTNKNDQFKKVYTQFESIIEKNAKDDSGANPFAALKYAYENFNDKKGIFSKFVRNGWSAGSYNLNEKQKPYKHKYGFDKNLGKDPFGLNQYARELASLEENEDDEDFRSYKSTFAPQINITVVFKEYDKYKDLKSLFKEYGYGFYSPKTKTIIIDGEVFIDSNLTFNDLKFVEAHEISHLIMNHSGPRSDKDELDADLGAYILLKSQNLPVDNLKKQFKFRHGIEFNEKLLDRVKDKF
jgi:hypothetical protein